MEEGILSRLLEALEKAPSLSKSPILAELVNVQSEPIEGQWRYPFHLMRYAAIEIIKSGIFVGDRLKGKNLPSSPPSNLTYPINDPEKLVFLISIPLVRDIGNDISRGMHNFAQAEIRGCFSEIVASLNRLSELIETWGKPIRMDFQGKKLEKLDFYRLEVKRYFSEIVANMNPLPGVIKTLGSPKTNKKIDNIKAAVSSLKEELLAGVPEDFFMMEDVIDYLANVLQRHVPKAPVETIARRVADIIEISHGQTISFTTIQARISRRKKKSI